ncbi:MAG: RNA polymerase sigma-70 factor [Ignavibacteriales bacterium]|nr:RNA polymerase sigma-70 factor [Ignavibacteriales bacterium]
MRSHILINDEELFQRIKSNDAQALKILFERHYSALCHFACKFVKNATLAEEAVSDVFLNIWLKKEKIELSTNLKMYLYTAVKNQSLNYLKKNKIHLEGIETVVKENITSDLRADKFIVYEESKNAIDNLLQQLPEKRRIIFSMNRFDGLSYKEIAEILSISIHTVQNQMVAAVKFLIDQKPRYQ